MVTKMLPTGPGWLQRWRWLLRQIQWATSTRTIPSQHRPRGRARGRLNLTQPSTGTSPVHWNCRNWIGHFQQFLLGTWVSSRTWAWACWAWVWSDQDFQSWTLGFCRKIPFGHNCRGVGLWRTDGVHGIGNLNQLSSTYQAQEAGPPNIKHPLRGFIAKIWRFMK